jgi:hypothetical protein
MDMNLRVRIVPKGFLPQSSEQKPTQISLFDAVRKWADEEDGDVFEIEMDGQSLSFEQIQEIAHSEEFKDLLMSYNERR